MTRLTNPPQHIFDNDTGISDAGSAPTAGEAAHRQTGEGTAPPEVDVADPHPSDEEHPYRNKAGGPMEGDIGPNPAVHDGTPPPRPHNKGSGPE